jgi:MFS family permease
MPGVFIRSPHPDSAEADGRALGWRHGFRALRHRNYRLFWSGQLVSVVGTWMSMLALSWLVLDLGASPIQLSLVGACQFGPILVLGLAGGVVADRFGKRSILLATQCAAALLAAILAVLVATEAVQLWHVYALTLGLGMVNALDMPTRQAFVGELVGPDDLMNAVALNATVFNSGRVIGPAIAGLLLASFGAAACFGINAISFLPVIAGLTMMRFPSAKRERPTISHLARLREGLSYVRGEPAVLLPIALVGFVGTFGLNFSVWIPLLAKDEFATGAAGFGLLMSSLGVGSLVGALSLAFGGRKPGWSAMLTTATALGVLELCLAVAGAARLPYLVALPILAGLGFSMSRTMATANTTVQMTAPAALRGRVMSVYMTVFAGTVPIGALIVGSVAEALGTPASIAVGGGIAIASALAIGAAGRRVHARTVNVSVRASQALVAAGGGVSAAKLAPHRDE